MSKPSESPTSLYDDARAFAIAAHAQAGVRYGEHPFEYHLDAVVSVLKEHGHDEFGLHAAAALHDVVEDTFVTIEEIGRNYGSIVRDYVDAVTDVKFDADGNPAGNRRARKLLTYAKLRMIAIRKGDPVVNLKLADRIANLTESITTRYEEKLGMYVKEHDEFVEQVKVAGGDPSMWVRLQTLIARARIMLLEIKNEKAQKHLDRTAV